MFNLFWVGFTLVVPLSAVFWKSAKELFNRFMPVLPWAFGLLFIFNWGMMRIAMFIESQGINVGYTVHDLVEAYESNYGILFVTVALYLCRRYVQQQRDGNKAAISPDTNSSNT